MGFEDLAKRHAGGARGKSKHVAILIVLAAIGAFAYLELRQRSAENKAADRTAADREIHAYFEATVKPALASATGEPAKLARPILPVVVRVDTKLDIDVYNRLDPGERTDRLAGAGSIAIVERADHGFYVGGGPMKEVSSSAVVTVFDVQSGRAVGKLVVTLAQPPPTEATQQEIDNYLDKFESTIAARLRELPLDVGR